MRVIESLLVLNGGNCVKFVVGEKPSKNHSVVVLILMVRGNHYKIYDKKGNIMFEKLTQIT